MGRSQLICTRGSLMVIVQYSNAYKDDKNEGAGTSSHTPPKYELGYPAAFGCRAPEDPVFCINDCDFFGSAATINMCLKCKNDMILLKQEHANLAAVSRKDIVRRSSSSDESKYAFTGAAVASSDLASQISHVKSKRV
ncbi:Zinc finger A20 and AN1 domain-containing stress-associated protein 2 [Capsicum baccatum]|uniref:Zinc finger A20 and AN1 domain-containing stress-associated protein 2 n=1 Tax=Capsicum baccatum TaxID=33114 RepID=A0A2G2VCG0_CAPBA|nr:Zinc finger A20 and AN1 domain-containing stress-associated protein 2 [Capsicum baccatum]